MEIMDSEKTLHMEQWGWCWPENSAGIPEDRAPAGLSTLARPLPPAVGDDHDVH